LSVKLSLDVPALERLLGGDTELELDLRKSVVIEFTRRHLKDLAESEAVRQESAAIRDAVSQAVVNHIGRRVTTDKGWTHQTESQLKSEIEELLGRVVEKKVDEMVARAVENRNKYEMSRWARHLDEKFSKMSVETMREYLSNAGFMSVFGAAFKQLVDAEVARRLKLAMEAANDGVPTGQDGGTAGGGG
jgi:hypothetical protein